MAKELASNLLASSCSLDLFLSDKKVGFFNPVEPIAGFLAFFDNVCSFWLLNHSTASLAHVVLSASLACHEMLHSCSLGPTI